MSAECIHGFEQGMCAICYPAAEPKPDRAAERNGSRETASTRTARATTAGIGTTRTSRGTRASGGTGSSGIGRPAGSRATSGNPVDVSRQRVYHVTHLDNLASILDDGALIADLELPDRPAVDISSDDVRQARRTTEIAGTGAPIAAHVPFFLSPDAYAWDTIRAGSADPRLSAAAYRGSAYDYVVLVTTVGDLRSAIGADKGDDKGDDKELVVCDGDAAAPRTRFDSDSRGSLLRIMIASDDPTHLLRGELLAPDRVPFSAITLVGVANNAQRAAVKELLDLAGAAPRVSVYPPWFQPTV